jgi:hypothetical protein
LTAANSHRTKAAALELAFERSPGETQSKAKLKGS